jgi:hypothetical protein
MLHTKEFNVKNHNFPRDIISVFEAHGALYRESLDKSKQEEIATGVERVNTAFKDAQVALNAVRKELLGKQRKPSA